MCGIIVIAGGQGDAARRRADAFEALRGALERRGPDSMDVVAVADVAIGASVLRMRAGRAWRQPAIDDETGCVLAWNGEWYASPHPDETDTAAVLALLAGAAGGAESAADARRRVAAALAETVRGPYAFALWVPRLRLVIYGRDPLGRRSLLRVRTAERLEIASTTPSSRTTLPWEEVSARGLGAVELGDNGGIVELDDEPWPRRPLLAELDWPDYDSSVAERLACTASPPVARDDDAGRRATAAAQLLSALSEAVRRRVEGAPQPVAVLFSGGIDSAVIACLCDRVCPPDACIELVNVAFGARGAIDASSAPDRIAARRTVRELRRACPCRDWRLVEVSVGAGALKASAQHVVALAAPNATHMDFNIAAALRHAAHGVGSVYVDDDGDDFGDEEASAVRYASTASPVVVESPRDDRCLSERGAQRCSNIAHPKCDRNLCGNCCRRRGVDDCGVHPPRRGVDEKQAAAAARAARRHLDSLEQQHDYDRAVYDDSGFYRRGPTCEYECQARVLLVGMGADELLAGYARHRTAWRRGGRAALQAELALDLSRIPQRNLGRDDRVVSDAAREARFPFLDEDVVALVRTQLDLDDIANLHLPPGVGCKRVLRDVARTLGLTECATLQKRAIQFGTRIASHSNKLAFGSNRRADGAAAFSVDALLAVPA